MLPNNYFIGWESPGTRPVSRSPCSSIINIFSYVRHYLLQRLHKLCFGETVSVLQTTSWPIVVHFCVSPLCDIFSPHSPPSNLKGPTPPYLYRNRCSSQFVIPHRPRVVGCGRTGVKQFAQVIIVVTGVTLHYIHT